MIHRWIVAAEILSRAKSPSFATGVSPSAVEISGVVVLLIAQFMANMDTAIANLATPSIGETLHANGVGEQWVVAAYVLTSAMCMITAARLSSEFGDRSILIVGLLVFTLASLACGVASDINVLIVSRGVQGIGAAMMIGQVLSGIRFRLHGEALTRAIGAYTVALSLSSVVGQVAGGAIVTADFFGSSWRPLFLLNVPIGAALLFGALWRMDNRGRSATRVHFDFWGAIGLAFAILLCVVPLSLGYSLGWPAWVLVALFLSGVSTIVLILRERHVSATGGFPLIDLRLFAVPGAAAGFTALALTRVVYFSLIFVIALYLQNGLHRSALESGLTLLTWIVAFGASGIVYPLIPRRFANLASTGSCLVIAASFGGLAALHSPGATFVTLLGIGGFAFGILSTALVNYLTATVDEALSANLSGVLATMIPLTAAIGVATYGSIYLMRAGTGDSNAAIRSFAYSCGLFSATSILAAIAMALAMNKPANKAS
jgi:MFS family permease